MSEYEKTTTPNMIVNRSTGTVLNTDMGAFAMIKKAREEKRLQEGLADRVAKLELDVRNLKQMLKQHLKQSAQG